MSFTSLVLIIVIFHLSVESLLCVLEAVQGGVKGLVVDEKGKPLSQARLEVEGREKHVRNRKY